MSILKYLHKVFCRPQAFVGIRGDRALICLECSNASQGRAFDYVERHHPRCFSTDRNYIVPHTCKKHYMASWRRFNTHD